MNTVKVKKIHQNLEYKQNEDVIKDVIKNGSKLEINIED